MIGFIFDSMWSRAKVHDYNKQDGQYLNRASIPIFWCPGGKPVSRLVLVFPLLCLVDEVIGKPFLYHVVS